jgi:hypothetical protein
MVQKALSKPAYLFKSRDETLVVRHVTGCGGLPHILKKMVLARAGHALQPAEVRLAHAEAAALEDLGLTGALAQDPQQIPNGRGFAPPTIAPPCHQLFVR